MKRTTIEQGAVLAILVAAGVGLRFYFQDIPNFAPVAAVALFAGFFFRSRLLAATAPLSVMLITDFFIGGYQPLLMVTVYGLLALPVFMRGMLRQHFLQGETTSAAAASVLGLLLCTLAASVLFFVATNFVTWLTTPWYPRTAAGLWQCYANAVPFFRYTLAGDMSFATVLFGSYAVCRLLVRRSSGDAALARQDDALVSV